MSKRGKIDREEEENPKMSVIFLSSSDEEEANEDLSLEIVAKARDRELKRKRKEDLNELEQKNDPTVVVVDPSSSSDEVEIIANPSGGEPKKKKKRFKKKKKKKIEENEKVNVLKTEEPSIAVEGVSAEAIEILDVKDEEALATVDTIDMEAIEILDNVVQNREPLETTEAADPEVNGTADNVVLRKLLRGPRYFDPSDSCWTTCYNCGKEGHLVANCTAEKRKKPCFVCGEFGHGAKHCTQGQDCFVCKRSGHFAKDCPEKYQKSSQNSKICLRCGDLGHEMSLCRNDYAPDDLKEIQCYVCKSSGHLCCADIIDNGPREVSCYNCGQSGHTGLGCAKSRRDTSSIASPTLCYKCGEEGHFARGCTRYAKSGQWIGEPSTPIRRCSKEGRDFLGCRSVPNDFVKPHKRKTTPYEGKGVMNNGKSRWRGGWCTDDPGDLPLRKTKVNGWKSHKYSASTSSGHYSNFRSPPRKHKSIPRTPSSHEFSASRFSNSKGRFGRSYD